MNEDMAVFDLAKNNAFIDINGFNANQQTMLMVMAQNGYVELTEILLEKGANANIQDPNGNTALHLASQNAFRHPGKLMVFFYKYFLIFSAHRLLSKINLELLKNLNNYN